MFRQRLPVTVTGSQQPSPPEPMTRGSPCARESVPQTSPCAQGTERGAETGKPGMQGEAAREEESGSRPPAWGPPQRRRDASARNRPDQGSEPASRAGSGTGSEQSGIRFRGRRADPEAVQRELPATENPGSPEGSGSPGNQPPEAVHQSLPEAAGQDRTGRGQRVPPPGRESGASAHAAVPQWRMVESAFPILHARGKLLLRPRTGDRGQAPVSVFSSPKMPLLPPCLNPLICFYKRTYLQESAPSGPGFPCRLPEGRAFAPARTPRETRAPDKSTLCMRHGAVPGRGNRAENRTRTGILFPARRSCRVALPARQTRANKDAQGRARTDKRGKGRRGDRSDRERGTRRTPPARAASRKRKALALPHPGACRTRPSRPFLIWPADLVRTRPFQIRPGPDAGPSPAAGRQAPGKPFQAGSRRPVSGNTFPATPSGERAAPETPGLRPFPSVGRRRS